jgi:ATP-dependent Lon protease
MEGGSNMSFYLNDKVRAVFPDESIAKIKGGYSFAGLNLPSYIRDWLVKKFTTPNGELNKSAMLDFCDQHLPQKSSNIRGRLLQREVLDLLVRVDIEVDIANGVYRFGLPDLGIKTNEGIIAHTVIEDNPHLGDGECWGVAKLQYYKDEDENSGRGFIEMVHFAPFKPYTPNLDYYMIGNR